MASITLDPTAAILTRHLGRLYDEADEISGRSTLLTAVAYARGVEGIMLPAPDAADSEHAIALLVFAGRMEEAAA